MVASLSIRRTPAWRLIVAAACAVSMLAPMLAPPQREAAQIVVASTTAPWYQDSPLVTDLGYKLQIRRDHVNGFAPLVAGNPWCETKCGTVWDDARLAANVRRHLWRAMRPHFGKRNSGIKAVLFCSWFRPEEVAKLCWLCKEGYAGWRTLEWLVDQNAHRQHLGAGDHVFTADKYMRVASGDEPGVIQWATGFFALTMNASDRAVYVNPDGGDDGNDGLDTGHPLATLTAGGAALRDGHGDWLLIARDSEYEGQNIDVSGKDGVSLTRPMLISTYGDPSGNRPVLQLNASQSNGVRLDGNAFACVESLEITDDLYTGHGSGSSGIVNVGGAWSGFIQNCVLHHITTGINTQAGVSNATFLRNYIHDCFDIETAQSGAGIFCQGGTGYIIDSENLIDHCGWCEDRTMLSGSIVTNTDSTHVTLGGSASAIDDVYVGAVFESSDANSPFIIIDYVGATKVATLDHTLDDGGAGAQIDVPYSITSAPPTSFRHNTYFQNDNEGLIRRRGFSTRAGNHGFGRCHGQIFNCIADSCPTGFVGAADTPLAAMSAHSFYENAAIHFDRDLTYQTGFGAAYGFCTGDEDAITAGGAWDDNIAANYSQSNSTFDVIGLALGLFTASTVTDNCCYGMTRGGFGSEAKLLAINYKATLTATISGNICESLADEFCAQRQVSAGTITDTWSGNAYYKPNATRPFYDYQNGGWLTWTEWDALRETGSSFTSGSTAGFLAPTRNIASYGGTTLALTIAALANFDMTTWTEATHGAIPCLNHIRAGFNKADVALAWPEGGSPSGFVNLTDSGSGMDGSIGRGPGLR